MSDHIRQSLILLLPVGRATLEDVPLNVGLSARSLLRSLERAGFTFGSLLNELRRELARLYLGDSHRTITETAEQLGYATPTSSTRWFSAEFGTSPRAWRAIQSRQTIGPPPIWKV